jgi:hypothetical protein
MSSIVKIMYHNYKPVDLINKKIVYGHIAETLILVNVLWMGTFMSVCNRLIITAP